MALANLSLLTANFWNKLQSWGKHFYLLEMEMDSIKNLKHYYEKYFTAAASVENIKQCLNMF